MTGMTDTMIDDRWARHGIAAERTREWQALGFGVLDAAAWSHHKIAPVDARAWERAGFYGGDLPSRAALWHHGGFTPQQAIGWGALPDRSPGGWVFPPSIAVSFRDAGFTPARASPWWRRGFTAAAAEKWRDDRFPVAVAERWVNGGFGDPDTAAPWIEAGATPAEAALFMRTCLDVDEAIEWRDRGFDPGSISGWVRRRLHPGRCARMGGTLDPAGRRRVMASRRVLRCGGVHVAGAADRTGRRESLRRAWAGKPVDGQSLCRVSSPSSGPRMTLVLMFQIDRATAQVLTFASAAAICASGPGKTRHSCPLSSHRTRYGGPPSGP